MSRDGIINLKGKEYPTWPFVLNTAHEKGLKGVTCELLQIPADDNGHTAIVCATAHFPDGDWKCYGDASPRNVNSVIATALIRMAETRAKGRALRDACNIGETMKEELGNDEPLPAPTTARQYARSDAGIPPLVREAPAPRPAPGPQPVTANGAVCSEEGCGTVLTAGQNTVSTRVYGKPLCPTHQSAAGKLVGSIASRPAV